MTSRSRDQQGTYLPPQAASSYLHRIVGATLSRRGFDAAEAGALAEMERLLEHHIQLLFENAHDYANHAGRRQPNARDLVAAQEASGWDVAALRKEAKRKRTSYGLPTQPEPPEPEHLANIASVPNSAISNGNSDVGPQLNKPPPYAWDGAPPLPDPWTYRPELPPPPPPATSKVTAGVLEFMKLTASERGDIPAELGLVDYRRGDTREVRRKWGVKGAGAT